MSHLTPPENEKILLLGFGDIAQRLTEHLPRNKYQITGLRRREAYHPNATMLTGDARNLSDMQRVTTTPFDVIVITLTPSEISDNGYRHAYVDSCQTLITALKTQPKAPRLILFVSSTSVYGQTNSEWVDENSATRPTSFSGKRLLEAEDIIRNSGFSSCIVRLSGIYGPGRERLINQVRKGEGSPADPPLYSNRIHAEDSARVLTHLIERQKNQAIDPLYLATDCEPTPLHLVKAWIAEQLQLPVDQLTPSAPARSFRSSKRCRNQRLLDTGYQFLYPTFREGYKSIL